MSQSNLSILESDNLRSIDHNDSGSDDSEFALQPRFDPWNMISDVSIRFGGQLIFHGDPQMTSHIVLPSLSDHVYNNPGPNPSESDDTESDDSGSDDFECRQYVMDRDNAITKALTDGADQCCILLEPIIPGDYYTVCSQCKNHFDLDAFEAWCNRRPSCPICRFDADKLWPSFICVESS